ncbi:hypothetical protein PFISCL1PPCAC_20933, partial [Pristionchus fissidentatus]
LLLLEYLHSNWKHLFFVGSSLHIVIELSIRAAHLSHSLSSLQWIPHERWGISLAGSASSRRSITHQGRPAANLTADPLAFNSLTSSTSQRMN